MQSVLPGGRAGRCRLIDCAAQRAARSSACSFCVPTGFGNQAQNLLRARAEPLLSYICTKTQDHELSPEQGAQRKVPGVLQFVSANISWRVVMECGTIALSLFTHQKSKFLSICM